MVKRLFSFLALLLVLFSIQIIRVSADSPPVLPARFWGTVKLDNVNVEAGTIITAEMGGVVVASSEVEFFEGDSVYSICIPGVASMEGERVDFFIDGQPADQYGIWHSGIPENLNLSIFTGELFQIFIPLVVK